MNTAESTPIIVIARIKTRLDARENWIVAAKACIAATLQEVGCLSYDMHESVTEPGSFVFVEQWRDKVALDFHMATPHLKAVVAAVVPCLAEAPTIEAIADGTRWRLM